MKKVIRKIYVGGKPTVCRGVEDSSGYMVLVGAWKGTQRLATFCGHAGSLKLHSYHHKIGGTPINELITHLAKHRLSIAEYKEVVKLLS